MSLALLGPAYKIRKKETLTDSKSVTLKTPNTLIFTIIGKLQQVRTKVAILTSPIVNLKKLISDSDSATPKTPGKRAAVSLKRSENLRKNKKVCHFSFRRKIIYSYQKFCVDQKSEVCFLIFFFGFELKTKISQQKKKKKKKMARRR